MIQCEHEYVMDGGIDLFKFDSRWFHRQSFDKLFPNMASVFPINGVRQIFTPSFAGNTAGIMETGTQVHDDENNFPPPDQDDNVTLGQGSLDGDEGEPPDAQMEG